MVIDDGSETESTGSSIDEQGDEPDGHQIAVERALAFLKGLDIDAWNSNVHGIPALLSATWEGRRDVIESLLLVGSPVNAVNANTGDSALMIAASRDDLEVVNMLLDATDIDLDLANKHGDTALMLAASNNCTTVVEALLHYNADVNKVNPVHGYTALLQAADFGWGEIVKMLLRAGAAINAVNPRGDSALILASAGKHREVVRYLLDQGADSKIVDRHGYTGLAAAIAAGDAAVVELFLERGHFLKDFNAAFELQDPFSVTVTDLMARSSNHLSLRTQSKDTLEFFRAVSRMTTPDKDAWIC